MDAATGLDSLFAFDNTYARLPDAFFARLAPPPAAAPQLVIVNEQLAQQLGLDPRLLASPGGIGVLSGKVLPYGAEPLAMVYAGHQFGHFVPQLGDGRAILLGEVIGRDGLRRDVQLKGCGPTPFSRRGDGRAALGPVLREYIISEAMAALGIPTTRSLAAVLTGEEVLREMPLPGAILTRVASSHIRVGTFQFFAARGDVDGVRRLADYVIARHYPEVGRAANRYRAMLDCVIERQARLIAQWMLLGFIHGVMNTDNMAISGETIDYGPCAFMDTYEPATVFSSIDRMGRYAYNNQPSIAHWNLARLAETLIPLLGSDKEEGLIEARAAIDAYPSKYEAAYLAGVRRKLGLLQERPDDLALAQDLLDRMAANKADFTLTFRQLCDAAVSVEVDAEVRRLFDAPAAFDGWAVKWRHRLASEGGNAVERRTSMRAVNPAYIPRNHRVEEAITAAVDEGRTSIFETLVQVTTAPFDDQPGSERYAEPPQSHQIVHQTFCGT